MVPFRLRVGSLAVILHVVKAGGETDGKSLGAKAKMVSLAFFIIVLLSAALCRAQCP